MELESPGGQLRRVLLPPSAAKLAVTYASLPVLPPPCPSFQRSVLSPDSSLSPLSALRRGGEHKFTETTVLDTAVSNQPLLTCSLERKDSCCLCNARGSTGTMERYVRERRKVFPLNKLNKQLFFFQMCGTLIGQESNTTVPPTPPNLYKLCIAFT